MQRLVVSHSCLALVVVVMLLGTANIVLSKGVINKGGTRPNKNNKQNSQFGGVGGFGSPGEFGGTYDDLNRKSILQECGMLNSLRILLRYCNKIILVRLYI